MPLGLSVVIPALGREAEVLRAVQSVRSSVPERTEIIVVDDGSANPLAAVLPPRNMSGVVTRVYRFNVNRGPQAARNLGIRRARFSHVAFLDSDDEFTPDKIDTLLPILRDSRPDVLFHDVAGMEAYARIAGIWDRRVSKFVSFRLLISLLNPVPTPALVVRRCRRLGAPTLRHSEDYAFLLRYCVVGVKAHYIPKPLAKVHRAPRTSGGLSEHTWLMRVGEFRARAVLLRSRSWVDRLRWSLGSLAGMLRIANDLLRGRYARRRHGKPPA